MRERRLRASEQLRCSVRLPAHVRWHHHLLAKGLLDLQRDVQRGTVRAKVRVLLWRVAVYGTAQFRDDACPEPLQLMRSFHVLLVLLLVAMAPARASADPAMDAATLKAEGDASFDKGHFADAYDAYRRAYAEGRDPALLYNQARALEAMGEYPEALDKLDAFAQSAPPDVLAKVPKLAELTADLNARTSTIHVTTNAPNAHLFIRGKDVGTIDRERFVRARAGDAGLRVVADGYEPFTKDLRLTGGERVDIDAQLAPVRDTTTKKEGGGVASKWWFWTVLGVVVVGGVAATALVLTSDKDPQTGSFSPGQIRVHSF
jgi:hypothetical protein